MRPCAIGELLTPTQDACIHCASGYYNFNHTASVCSACPGGARCSDPDLPGMVLPEDGVWHANPFSEQVWGRTRGHAGHGTHMGGHTVFETP